MKKSLRGDIAYVATVYGVMMAVATPSLVVLDLMAKEQVDSVPAVKEISISPVPTAKKFDGPFPGQRAATIAPISPSTPHVGPIQSA